MEEVSDVKARVSAQTVAKEEVSGIKSGVPAETVARPSTIPLSAMCSSHEAGVLQSAENENEPLPFNFLSLKEPEDPESTWPLRIKWPEWPEDSDTDSVYEELLRLKIPYPTIPNEDMWLEYIGLKLEEPAPKPSCRRRTPGAFRQRVSSVCHRLRPACMCCQRNTEDESF